jgi:copper(I)-binding protein
VLARLLPASMEADESLGADVRTEPVAVRRFGVGVAAAAALLTSACAAGQHAQTAQQKSTIDGTNASVGSMDLRGLAIQAPVKGTYYEAGSDALVKLVIVNSGSRNDTLTGISSPSFVGWSAYPSASDAESVQSTDESSGATPATAPAGTKSVPVPAGTRVSWGVPEATGGLLLKTFKKPAYPGTTVNITFTFAKSGSKTLPVPIALTTGPNDSVLPGPSATGEQG